MKSIVILGSTGSIGTQCLDVIRQHKDRFRVLGLAAGANGRLLAKQVEEFRPRVCGLVEAKEPTPLPADWEGEFLSGPEVLSALAVLPEADMVVVATVGAAGLDPTLQAIASGKDIAIANKEVLVMAGDLAIAEARKHAVRLLPIDSEHSAVLQCLTAGRREEIRSIILTASGGPFRRWDVERIPYATPEDALAHPTWDMGPKITIDSATMFNKGLEIIEAHHLFDLPVDRIHVLIHPQSIVHSMVEYCDGSVIAQLGTTDMRTPIQLALSYPERLPAPAEPLDLTQLAGLEFMEPDMERYPCLELAREAAHIGGTMPAFLSVVNEELVAAFLGHRIGFGAIPDLMAQAMERHTPIQDYSLQTIHETDREARMVARGLMGGQEMD
ncbi:MAG TPA: 1-deoxy-D-xylulose-5-phosphate reductoisomerase [bacterium]|nr:1-deoxy-D-xylulose-5-phosphate reductoisomerase [bacterium]HQL61296.1 1-deoxy-D-xylulose-5-phosphate reductoisomerase [bacterium]